MAIVKADAYGHGAAPVARAAGKHGGIGHFGVACLSEAQELRRAGIRGEVYTLGSFLPGEAAGLVQNDVTPFVSSFEQVMALHAAGKNAPLPARCVLTVDTGMGREGLLPRDALLVWRETQTLGGVKIAGLATHFSSADEPNPTGEAETKSQTACFADFVRGLRDTGAFAQLEDGRGNRGVWISVSNSPGIVQAAALPPDLCGSSSDGSSGIRGVLLRPGLLLYGIAPFQDALQKLPEVLRPALAWRARITLVRDLPEGATVGYGKTHTLRRLSRIATVAAGYADGLSRRLGNRGRVLLPGGGTAPLVGRVSMDQCQIDVTDCPNAAVGDTVTFIGQNETNTQTVFDLAEWMDTTPHEPTCLLSRRVARVYRGDAQLRL